MNAILWRRLSGALLIAAFAVVSALAVADAAFGRIFKLPQLAPGLRKLGSCIRRGSLVALVLIGLVEAPAASAAVGRTPTRFDVSATGEASYVIPIFTPPGIHGLTPQLALAYGHRSGGSLVGVGWNIAGLSAIRRCARTWAQDGTPAPVILTYEDRFCLDGVLRTA